MKIDAPKELRAWLATIEARLAAFGVACDLRTPRELTDTSKASLALDAGAVLGSMTIWATGMVEFIAMSRRSRKELAVRDVEIPCVRDVGGTLSNLLDEFIELASAEREE